MDTSSQDESQKLTKEKRRDLRLCLIAPPSLGKTHVAKTPWGRRHAIDTDHAIKLLNNEQAWDKGGREEWVIDGAISFVSRAAQMRTRTGDVVILTNLAHVFDFYETKVVLPRDAGSYLAAARESRPDLAQFDDGVMLKWLDNYRAFAQRNNLKVIEVDKYLAEVEEISEAIRLFHPSN